MIYFTCAVPQARYPFYSENEANLPSDTPPSRNPMHVETALPIFPFTWMTMAEDDLSFASTLSNEDLAWLQASIVIDSPPTPPPKSNDRGRRPTTYVNDPNTNSSLLSSLPEMASFARKSITPQTPPRKEPVRSEWLYRRPKSPMTRSTESSPRPSTGSSCSSPSMTRSPSNTSSITTRSNPRIRPVYDESDSYTSLPSQESFWPSFFGPRPRSERSVPHLKTILSESYLGERTPPSPSGQSTRITTDQISAPMPIPTRPPSVSSTLSSPSTYSSRSASPSTPVSAIPSPPTSPPRTSRPHPYHYQRRQRRTTHDPSTMPSSCPPSRSILTRSPSISTKSSIPTTSKSVKFAAIPIVHYASKEFWELDGGGTSMGISVDSMDVDEHCEGQVTEDEIDDDEDDVSMDTARFRDLVCATPTPEREKEKARGLKRLMDMAKKPIPIMGLSGAAAHRSSPNKIVISAPYQLGTFPNQLNNSSTTSLGSLKKSGYRRATQLDFPQQTRLTPSLRTAPSMESFRSAKSATARSVRSMGSFRSSASSRGLRSWLTRTLGWTET